MSKSGPPKLMVVDDDPRIRELLRRYLSENGFSVATAENGASMNRLWQRERFDALILDLMLPGEDGLAILRRLRGASDPTPVIMLTAKGEDVDRIVGLELGADDYLPKPFNPRELLARIHAVLRRSRAAAPQEIHLGALTLDLVAHRASVAGVQVPLTGKEYACLEFLATRRGMTVTKEMFLTHLYGGRDEPEMKIIDVFICKLRRKLTDAGAPKVIETVWGRGYTIANDA
jgi:two-component system phosphate regulon response regulator OmpR